MNPARPDAPAMPPQGAVWRTLLVLFSVVFLNLAGFGLMIPILPFFADGLHAAAWQVTLLFSAYSLGQLFAEPLWGRLSDRVGRKPILVLTTASNAIGYFVLAHAQSIEAAILIRLVMGFGAGNISAIQGYVADVSPPQLRAGRMGFLGAAFGLGFIAGPGGGLLLGHETGQAAYRLLLYGSAGLCAASCLGVLAFVRESRRPGAQSSRALAVHRPKLLSGFGEAARNPVIRRVVTVTFVFMGAFSGMESTFALWSHSRYGWIGRDVSAAFILVGTVSAVTQGLLTGRLARRFSEARVLTLGILLFGASLAVQVAQADPRLVAIVMCAGTFGMALSTPNIAALISRSSSPETQGALLGVNMAASSSARIVGPVIAGQLFSHVGPDAPFVVGACLTLPAAMLAMDAGQAFRRAQAAPAEP